MQESAIKDKILAIGSQFLDDKTGEKQIPVYTKDPKTGLMKTSLVVIGVDEEISGKVKALEGDLNMAFEDIQKNNNDQQVIEYYKSEIEKQYGGEGVNKLDEMLAE